MPMTQYNEGRISTGSSIQLLKNDHLTTTDAAGYYPITTTYHAGHSSMILNNHQTFF